MCHFISAILPASADLDRLAPIAAAHRRALRLTNNPHLAAQIAPTERCYATTLGHCDCGTELGSNLRSQPAGSATEIAARKVPELQRRGWSAAKIQRWLAQHESAATREKAAARQTRVQQTPGAIEWCSFIKDALASGAAPTLGLFLHFYRGDLDLEPLRLHRRNRFRGAEIEPALLLSMPEDTVYESHR